jgi:glucose/arabinose dehydrogenase
MDRWVTRRGLLAAAGTAVVAGCTGGPGGDESATETPTERATAGAPAYDLSVSHDAESWDRYAPDWEAPTTVPAELTAETLVTNLEIPWDISVAANGDTFLTERPGRLVRYTESEVVEVTAPADAIDAGSVEPGADEGSWWVEGGEGGTMGVEAHPNYPDVPVVYLYYTAETDDGRVNRLAYVDIEADDPGATTTTLLEAPAANIHNGGRITFGPANYLWVCVGDHGEPEGAADPSTLTGAVLRLTPTGEPAPGNPDRGGDADDRIYSMGHRNPQGLAWLPDASPIAVEHGPGPDEVNLLGSGGNHGWPSVRQPEEYADADVRPPVASTALEPTWAPSGSLFYTGDAVPSLRNRLLVGCLASQELTTVTLTPPEGDLPPLGETGVRHEGGWLDDRFVATTHDRLTDELGRIRHVEQGRDGALYAITSNRDGRANGRFPTESDDRLVRLTQN